MADLLLSGEGMVIYYLLFIELAILLFSGTMKFFAIENYF